MPFPAQRYLDVVEGVAIAALLDRDFEGRGEALKVALGRVTALAAMKRKSRLTEPDDPGRPPLEPGKI